jgi:HSP20 family molecular chaperone IbpA
MATNGTKELTAKEKHELTHPAEKTRPGLMFTPDVDIFETDQALTLLADMPGVTAEKLSIDLRDNILTITGEAVQTMKPEETPLLVEYNTGTYYRQFSVSEIIDQDKIDANLKDGVLCLTLPKVEKATPRKITVTAS